MPTRPTPSFAFLPSLVLVLLSLGLSLGPRALGGCASVQKITSALETSGAKVLEAQTALDLIGARLDDLALVPAVASAPAFQKARAALTQARSALHAASSALQEAQAGVVGSDPTPLLAAFADAWRALDAALAVLETVAAPAPATSGMAGSPLRSLRVPAPAAAR